MYFAKSCGYDLDSRVFFDHIIDHAEEGAGIELRLRRDLWATNSESHLQVFFVADQDIDVFHDAVNDRQRALMTAPDIPELGAVIQIERRHHSSGLGCLHRLDDELTGGFGKRRKDSATV